MAPSPPPDDIQSLESKISQLEQRLSAARLKLQQQQPQSPPPHPQKGNPQPSIASSTPSYTPFPPSLHILLLLSDSALPLGSFAFSSGLESYLHHINSDPPPSSSNISPPKKPTPQSSFPHFLSLSLSSHAGTTLPYVLAAWDDPALLPVLDDEFDASVMCAVARRGSTSQGRALLAVWEKSFVAGQGGRRGEVERENETSQQAEWLKMLKSYSLSVKRSSSILNNAVAQPTTSQNQAFSFLPEASAHLPPLFGALSRLLGLSREDTAHTYLISHLKSVLSAAVRAGVFGPYHAQRVLASAELREMVSSVASREWGPRDGGKTQTGESKSGDEDGDEEGGKGEKEGGGKGRGRWWEDAGQHVPVVDLWMGRHECLYSRVFNS